MHICGEIEEGEEGIGQKWPPPTADDKTGEGYL
jgi:hypothetical protein